MKYAARSPPAELYNLQSSSCDVVYDQRLGFGRCRETGGIESAPSPEQDVSRVNLCIESVIKLGGGKQKAASVEATCSATP